MTRYKTSGNKSFEGYNFREALYRNKDSVKAVLAVITGANFLVGFELNTFLLSLAGGAIALGLKLLADAVDFWFGEIEL